MQNQTDTSRANLVEALTLPCPFASASQSSEFREISLVHSV